MAFQLWLEKLCDTLPQELLSSDIKSIPVFTGVTTINGQKVAVYAQNHEINKGFMTASNAEHICQLLDLAEEQHIPVVALLSSPGISFEDQLASGKAYTKVIRRHIELQGIIPQIAVLMGPVMGAPAYSAVLMDMIIFSQYRSYLMVTSPSVVQKAIGEKTTMAELGNAHMHATTTGLADFVLPRLDDQLEHVRVLLNYIQGSFKPSAPKEPMPIIPREISKPFNMHTMIKAIVDASEYHEYKSQYGRSMITAFARLEGFSIGIVANQSNYQSGAINCEAAQKSADFIRLCDKYRIPIVTLIDVPGFMPGKNEEQNGLLRHGADFCRAMQTKVPRMSVVIRRCYGAAAFLLMQTRALKGQLSLALASAQLGVMGQDSVNTFNQNDQQKESTLAYALELDLFDDIIRQEQIRDRLIDYLRNNL